MMSIDASYQKLQLLIPEITAALDDKPNEAAHRLHAVDRFLREILDWPSKSIYPEEYTSEGRIDYFLKNEGVGQAVVEAKGRDTFWFPVEHPSGKAYRLSGPVYQHAAVASALKQASQYCESKKVALCVATNGVDWIIFQGNRIDGIDVFAGVAFLFQGFDGVAKNFALFYSLLHADSVLRKNYIGHFADVEKGVDQEFRFSKAFIPTNQIQPLIKGQYTSDITSVCNKFFRDIIGENVDDLLNKCFIETKESKEAEQRLERIARNLTESIEVLGASTEPLARTVESAMTHAGGEHVLVVGVKGAGKSTFITRFFDSILEKTVRNKCMVLCIDVGAYTGAEDSISHWLDDALLAQIDATFQARSALSFNHIRGIFSTEYNRLSKTTFATIFEQDRQAFDKEFGQYIESMRRQSPFTYAATSIGHMAKGFGKLPIIIFDNADHFSPNIQEAVFQYGVSISKHREVKTSLILLPITERTLWGAAKNRESAFLSHFSTKFYLPPPSPKQVIERRLSYILEKMGSSKERSSQYLFGRSMHVSFDDLYKVVATLQEILAQHLTLGLAITNLANGNIRTAFDLFRRIITSGHLKLEDVVKVAATGKASLGSLYTHAMKALIRGEYGNFRAPSTPYICNLFDPGVRFKSSPLLSIRILTYLREKFVASRYRKRNSEADVPISEFIDFFLGLGAGRDEIVAAADALLEKELIEANDPTISAISEAEAVALTLRGLQHLKWVRLEPLYIEAMAEVSYIHDEPALELLLKAFGSQQYMPVRKQFINYCIDLDHSMYIVPPGDRYRDQSRIADVLKKRWVRDKEEF
jgi:hypothetical protein